MAALLDGPVTREEVLEDAGALIAAGLPWDAIWSTEVTDLEPLVRGFTAARNAAQQGAEGGVPNADG